MAKSFQNIRDDSGGGGGGAVDSVNGQTGIVVLAKGDVGLGNVDNTSDLNKPVSTATQSALDLKQDLLVGTINRIARFDGSGVVTDVPTMEVTDDGYYTGNYTVEPNGLTGSFFIYSNNMNVAPLQNSPNEAWQVTNNQVTIDPSSSGFSIGTNGQSVKFIGNNVSHSGTSDIGTIDFIQNNFSIGNGTDPLDFRGVGYCYGFGVVNANVTISGPLQGYGFQPNINASAAIDPASYLVAFYDNTTIGCASSNYTSFNSGPSIAEIQNNTNYGGLSINPTIDLFTGNSGFTGVGIYGNLGTFSGGSYHGLQINPFIDSGRYCAGIEVSMDNVTLYAGTVSSLTIQDLTFTFNAAGDNNSYTMAYTGGGTAGSEVVSILGQAISVQIESGVSTANQIKTALDATIGFNTAVTVTVSGTGTNPQTTVAATSFTGGNNPGTKYAAYLDGDVNITGSLTFGGALSIGQLNAFATQAVINSGGTPVSIHTLISSPTVAANATIANADTLGVNTAMLLQIGDNATVTSAFTGLVALALPAVISMGVGSTVDQVSGATYAVSLDGGATGGTIANLDLCRSIAIPNGTTTITRLNGYKFDLPFGDPGTTTWGFYASPTCHNYLAGNLMIGGTAGSDDTVANSSVGLELKSTTKAFLPSRMTGTERDALTAVDGMVLYNTTTSKLQVRAGGSWVDLH